MKKPAPSVKRKIYLWNKADFIFINQLVTEFTNTSLNNTIETPIEDLWYAYKAMCMRCLQLVPTRTARSGKCSQPWATPIIRCLTIVRNRNYITELKGVA